MFHGLRRRVPEYSVYSGTSTYLMLEEDFEACLMWSRRAGRIVSLADIPCYLSGAATEPGILFTFDDGLRSVIDLACPLLSAHGATAVVFVTTDWVDGGIEPAVFRIERDLWDVSPQVLTFQRDSHRFEAKIGTRSRISATLNALWNFCFRYRIAPLSLRADEFALDGRVWQPDRMLDDPEGWTPASWASLRAAVNCGVLEVEAHGKTHGPWGWMTQAQLEAEVKHSALRLLDETGKAPIAFSYPHGSVSPMARAVAKRSFTWSFTSRARRVRAGHDAAEALPRFHIPSERPVRIASELKYPLAERVRRKLRSIIGG